MRASEEADECDEEDWEEEQGPLFPTTAPLLKTIPFPTGLAFEFNSHWGG